MKQLVLLITFSVLTPALFGQIYLGFTRNEIVSRVSEKETYQEAATNDSGLVLTVRWKGANAFTRFYYFKEPDGRCYLYIVEPLSEAAKRSLVEFCNQEYVVLGTKNWRVYQEELTVSVSLRYVEKCRQHLFYYSAED